MFNINEDISSELFIKFIISLLIGLLIGFERQFSRDEKKAYSSLGSRTLALLSISGTLTAYLEYNYIQYLSIITTAGVIGLIALFYYISYRIARKTENPDFGMTTEIAAIITFVNGILVFYETTLAIALAIVITLILSIKKPLHSFVAKLEKDDVSAVLKFLIVTFIILPVLPDQDLKIEIIPVTVNPSTMWKMVVLIAFMGFSGYILIKVLGKDKGIMLSGFLGGIVSSTAATIDFSRRSRASEGLENEFSLAIILACTMVFPRVFIEIIIFNIALVKYITIPFTAMTLSGIIYSLYLYRKISTSDIEHPNFQNPFTLKSAIQFGLIFGVIIVIVQTTTLFFKSDLSIYLVSLFSGLTDVDAIALSLADLSNPKIAGSISLFVAGSGVSIGAMANSFLKLGITFFIGSKNLFKKVLWGFIFMIISGLIAVLVQPYVINSFFSS